MKSVLEMIFQQWPVGDRPNKSWLGHTMFLTGQNITCQTIFVARTGQNTVKIDE